MLIEVSPGQWMGTLAKVEDHAATCPADNNPDGCLHGLSVEEAPWIAFTIDGNQDFLTADEWQRYKEIDESRGLDPVVDGE